MEILCTKCGQPFHTDAISTMSYRYYCQACDLTPRLTKPEKKNRQQLEFACRTSFTELQAIKDDFESKEEEAPCGSHQLSKSEGT